ncbi:hypothetical protein E6Q11_01670 [Candidatus Dojkabacteria bacterium]|uniref:Phage terminase small subunit P27 family n=1 Tax=Candidatus Dojkabacteria bacterium TaxID=2099670 RepID=A0A5C7J916_9BACT|nr:MAG: hypothetical protein E6Q11_01670 [Candidatus Dojkabacteria bacterium]
MSASYKRGRNRKVKFPDGRVIVTNNNSGGKLEQTGGSMGIHDNPDMNQVTEMPAEAVQERDQYDDLEYPPPIRDKEFRQVWAQGIKNITERENFNESHLTLYETYCNLLVALRRQTEFINKNGQTYRIMTVTGEVRRTYPEVLERNKTIAQIASYAKLLDLLPKKDKSKTIKKEDAADWS